MAISKLSDRVRLLGASLKNLNPTAIYNKINELVDIINDQISSSPKVYAAVLTQSGTNNPVVQVIKNTLGEDLEWSRINVGEYATISLVLDVNKTIVLHSGSDWGNIKMVNNSFKVEVFTTDTTTAAPTDDVLSKTSIQILVYN